MKEANANAALKLALEALESCYSTGDDYKYQFYDDDLIIPAITAIKEALAQSEQEPVAWEQFHEHMAGPFYKVPPQRTWKRPWVSLTDEEIISMSRYDLQYAALIGEVQRKLKEKNK